MLQLLNLNVEGAKHTDRVFRLLDAKPPAVVCLQEAPEAYVAALEQRGYQVTFVPLTLRPVSAEAAYPEGLILATQGYHVATVHHYHDTGNELLPFSFDKYRDTWRLAVIMAEVAGIHIATTHFTWTPDGRSPNMYQQEDIIALTSLLDTFPSHVLCGDLNIPRYHNRLYKEYLLPRYHDAVPESYDSSLDPMFHRLADDPERQHLFADFMVDHLLVQDPLQANNVALTFGVSDHAAVTASITQK